MSRSETIALAALIIAILGIVSQWFTTRWQVRVMKQTSSATVPLPESALNKAVAVLVRWARNNAGPLGDTVFSLFMPAGYYFFLRPSNPEFTSVDAMFFAITLTPISTSWAVQRANRYAEKAAARAVKDYDRRVSEAIDQALANRDAEEMSPS